jgi:hypothetical protein
MFKFLFDVVKEGGEFVEKGGKLAEGGRVIGEQIVKWGWRLIGADEKEIEENLKSRTLILSVK